MSTIPPPPPHQPEFEGDYRPVDPANPSAHLDPVNARVEPADVAYLAQLAEALNTTLDLETLLNRTSELVRAVIHYRIFAILLLNDRTHELRVRFQIGHTTQVERARIPLQMEANPGQEKTRFVKDSLLTIHEQITQRWQAALASEAEGEVARQYLAQRGVSPEAVKLFRLGYAPERWDDTINWARSRGHEISLLEQAGLVIRKEQSDQYYDRFRGRLMFPICDEQGRVIGFSGRILDKEKSPAKYVNSPETLLFTKGRVIYGLDKSKREILDKESVVICEGQLDLIACFMAGVRNIVAPQGTAFTSDQARVLRRYADEAVLCFDSDNAGQNATMRSLDILLAAGMSIRVAVVPAPHDPDSFIKQFGPEAFQKLVAEAGGFFEFFLDYLCRQNDPGTDKGRAAIVRLMGENLAKTGNAVLIDTYAQKTALRLGVSPDSVAPSFVAPPPAPLPARRRWWEQSPR